MKGWTILKKIIIGIVSGVLLSTATGVFASSNSYVQAILFPSTITIHKEKSTTNLISNNTILNYNNSVYVPLRSFAESIGSEVRYFPANETENTLPQIAIFSVPRLWSLTFLGAGNQFGSPLFVRINTLQLVSNNSIGIHASIHNTGKEIVLIKPFKLQVNIFENGQGNQLVWSGEIASSVVDADPPSGDIIPATDSKVYWGIRSPILYWKKKDLNGNPVPSGEYKVQISPVTIEYDTFEPQGAKTQTIEPDMHSFTVVSIP
jgi:hypothetical protein